MSRLDKYYDLSMVLQYMSDETITKELEKASFIGKGFGENKILEIGETKIFTKKIPLHHLFEQNKFTTKNIYNLPSHYNYGIGSAGFGPWRELLLYIKASNFVLSGKCDHFPLLYHYRIIKEKAQTENNADDIDWAKKRWDNNQQILKFVTDGTTTNTYIILFTEYIENVLYKSFGTKITYESFVIQSMNIINFLNKNGILHMDSHYRNFLVDNDGKLYLVDFGLSLDKEFELSQDEIDFFEKNSTYDIAKTLSVLIYFNETDQEKIQKKYNKISVKMICEKLDEIKELIEMDEYQYRKLSQSQNIILLYYDFIENLISSTNKAAIIYPNDEMKELISVMDGGYNYKNRYLKYTNKIMQDGGKAFDILEKKIKILEYINNKAYALNNIDDEVLDEKSQFPIGSITKVFTMITLLILQEKKMINILDTFGKYFDNKELAKTKIIDVINHVSGMKNINSGHDYRFGSKYKYKNATESYLSFAEEKLLTEKPGTHIYSNIGYIILGALIEKICEKDYRDVVDELILTPLKMHNTTFDQTNITLYEYSEKLKKIKKLSKYENYERTFASSAGQIASTIEDLIKFKNFVKLLNKKSLKLLQQLYIYNESNNIITIKHSGGIPGGRSNLEIKYDNKWNCNDVYIKLLTGKS